MSNSNKIGLALVAVGIGLALFICFVSIALYGKIYFFDGYEITKIAWIISVLCIIGGLIGLSIGSTFRVITLVIGLIIALCVSCSIISDSDSGGSNYNGNNYSGSYRCDNCGGDGWDSANGCSCVWCGGDGRTSWNP